MQKLYWYIYQEYTISILLLNILIYLLITMLLFSLFFFFDQQYFRTLNELQGFNSITFFTMSFIFGLLSLAGMPPLAGFVSKFLLVLALLKNYAFFLLFIFVFINFFMIYFYVQNMKLIQRPSVFNFIRIKNAFSVFDFKLIYFITILNTVNWFGILVISDFLIFLNFINSHIRIG